jgi:hypothetical protein
MRKIFSLLFLLVCVSGFSQTLPLSRSVDWTLAGLRDTTTNGFIEIDMQAQGVVGNGTTSNDSIVGNVLLSITTSGAILNFPSGNFLFNNTINLPNNIIIKGEGAEVTSFTMDLGGTGHSFRIQGQAINSDTTSIINFSAKNSDFVIVSDPNSFSTGDWIQIAQYDSDLVTSSWAENTVGQIVKVKTISNNKIVLESPLRMDYDTTRSPYILKVIPAENVGIECLKIHRIDNTAPQQSSNVFFSYAVNCWVSGIESENCTFSHIQANRSSNLHVSKSYFHHGFEYGGGGRAYGVMLQATSNECLVENNIFEHLRHSMIVQSGANGNVFSYNYSFDPYWESTPNNSSGDLVLHGNYVYANLFEQNICQNIIIDNSHGPNGPYNTMFRNRAEGFGIFFSSNNSPYQNFLGNEIPNTSFPYNIVNYTIQGTNHFIHGNNNKGTIHPAGTSALMDSSYAYSQKVDFIPIAQWAGIGTPNIMGSASIPALDRYNSGTIFSNACNGISVSVDQPFKTKEKVMIFPNPVESEMTIESSHVIQNLTVINLTGEVLHYHESVGFSNRISTVDWRNGLYFILINFVNDKSITEVIVKTNSY